MTKPTITQLQAENSQLRDMLVSLSATLLQEAAALTSDAAEPADAQRLLRQAEECFRCARMPGVKPAIAEGLQAAGHELMARAVEMDTQQQRAEKTGK